MEKGEPNVDLPDEVILLIVSFLLFFFTISFFYFFFNVKYGRTPLFIAAANGYEQIVQILLVKGKPNVNLPDEVILLIVSFSFFSFSHFSFFFNVKDGRTPLHFAAFKGHKQIVQILLEKGKPNVDLPDKVILLIVFFFFFFFFFSLSHIFLFFNVKDGQALFLLLL